jgi:hypothetical protein
VGRLGRGDAGARHAHRDADGDGPLGHRFASLAISYGAKLVDDEGNFVVDEGLKTAIRKFVAWHRDGTMPMDSGASAPRTATTSPTS